MKGKGPAMSIDMDMVDLEKHFSNMLASKDEVSALRKEVRSMAGLLLDIRDAVSAGAGGSRSSGSAYPDEF